MFLWSVWGRGRGRAVASSSCDACLPTLIDAYRHDTYVRCVPVHPSHLSYERSACLPTYRPLYACACRPVRPWCLASMSVSFGSPDWRASDERTHSLFHFTIGWWPPTCARHRWVQTPAVASVYWGVYLSLRKHTTQHNTTQHSVLTQFAVPIVRCRGVFCVCRVPLPRLS